jgi:hypothetical protein
VYAGFCVLQVEIQVFSQGFDGCFAGVVCCVPWRVRDALFAACNDNGTCFARCAGLEGRRIGVQPIDDTVEIGVKNLWVGYSVEET